MTLKSGGYIFFCSFIGPKIFQRRSQKRTTFQVRRLRQDVLQEDQLGGARQRRPPTAEGVRVPDLRQDVQPEVGTAETRPEHSRPHCRALLPGLRQELQHRAVQE